MVPISQNSWRVKCVSYVTFSFSLNHLSEGPGSSMALGHENEFADPKVPCFVVDRNNEDGPFLVASNVSSQGDHSWPHSGSLLCLLSTKK